jgi:thioredoxin 1
VAPFFLSVDDMTFTCFTKRPWWLNKTACYCSHMHLTLNDDSNIFGVCKQIVVDFTATWCGPCRIMSPIFIELSKKYPGLIFLKVDVDEVPDVTSAWEIRAMPTFLFIKEGKLIDKIVGANKDELDRKVQHYASQSKS